MAGSPPRAAALLSLSPKSSADARPYFGPAPATRYGPQRHERVDVRACPVHAAALQPHLDHHFVGTLRAAAANRVAGRLEGCVLYLHQARWPERPAAAR